MLVVVGAWSWARMLMAMSPSFIEEKGSKNREILVSHSSEISARLF